MTASPEQGSIRGLIARGGLWMAGSSLATRVTSFVAQIALGRLLSDEDFGVYAIAISIGALASVLRDGGARQILIERGWREREYIAPAFWLGGVLNVAAAGALVAAGPLLQGVYGESSLGLMLTFIASGLILGTPSAVFRSKLSFELRMRDLATLNFVSAMLRYGGVIAFAVAGYGPLSFVIPIPLIVIVEGVLGYLYTREQPWRMPPRVDLWRDVLLQMRWVVLGVGAVGVINMGPHMVIGLVLPTAVLGVYYFAFQIVLQVGAILSTNINDVLFPSFVRIKEDRSRLGAGALEALQVTSLVAVLVCVLMATAIAPLELLLWGGKWVSSVRPVQIMSLLYPFNVALAAGLAAQQATGEFRAWSLSLWGLAAVAMLTSYAGALMTGSAVGVALFGALSGAAASVLYLVTMFRSLGVSGKTVVTVIARPWLIGSVASVAAITLQIRLGSQLSILATLILFPSLATGAVILLLRWLDPAAVQQILRVGQQQLGTKCGHRAGL
ncbi:oligosaccharide flippase family protein [Gemmatimonadota bacterium]